MPEETVGGGLLDVTSLTLEELDQIDHPTLRRVLQRILDDKDTGPVAGFSSSLEDDEAPQTGDFRLSGQTKS